MGVGDGGLACLPGPDDDAPAGHVSHQKVRFCDHAQGHLYHFVYNKQHFQVTLAKACNSPLHAARLARLCYLRFQAGDTKEEVVRYREAALKDLKARWARGELPKEEVE